ncbi:MAG: phage terminase large subunit [Chloroflexota bacterium]
MTINLQRVARNTLQRVGLPVPIEFDDQMIERAEKIYGSVETYRDYITPRLAPDQLANFERAGIILQPIQIGFCAAARKADELGQFNELAMGGARGGSKSFTLFSQVAVDDCQRFPDLKFLYLRLTEKSSKEQLHDLVAKTLRRVNCDVNTERIMYPNGSRILIGGFKDDKEALKYQGLEYDGILIEELTQLRQSTYTTLGLSNRTSKDGWRPRIYTSFNPMGVGHMFVKKRFIIPYRQGTQTDTFFIPATVDDNVMVNPEYVNKLDNLHGAEKKAYRHGDFDVASGAYFETWHYDTHVIPILESIPESWPIWMSMDAGFSHWNITQLFGQDSDGNKFAIHELAHRKCQPDIIGPDIVEMLAGYGKKPGDLQRFSVGTDAFALRAGQEKSLVQQYRPYGFHMTQADMSPGSRIAGWQTIGKLMGDPGNTDKPKESKLFITLNCPRLIETLPYLMRNPNNPEDVLKVDTTEDGEGGDDAGDCARYGLHLKRMSSIA